MNASEIQYKIYLYRERTMTPKEFIIYLPPSCDLDDSAVEVFVREMSFFRYIVERKPLKLILRWT